MALISRDPFTRQELHRRVVQINAGPQPRGCFWCGNLRMSKTGKASLYEYRTEPDRITPRPAVHSGMFCSKSCHDNYHG